MSLPVAPPGQPGSVLLVDDDALFLRTLQRAMQRRGIATQVASSAADALALAHDAKPDFAVIDLKLGPESGLALVEPIKRGADDYLIKPATVDMILRSFRDDPASGPTPATDPSPTMTPLSRLEWEHIQQALTETQGNISAAARLLGMHRRSLQRKLAKKPGPERPPGD
jgi:two-component system, response regulator RegA